MRYRSFFETTRCPHCGRAVDAHMAMSADARPEPGDLSICALCASLSEYGPDLQLVPEGDRLAVVSAHPDVIRARQTIRAVLNERRPIRPGSAPPEGPDR